MVLNQVSPANVELSSWLSSNLSFVIAAVEFEPFEENADQVKGTRISIYCQHGFSD
jgi:hypothetical protein